MRTEKEPICALNGKKCVSPGLFAKCTSPAEYTNDINPKRPAKYHMDAIDFCRQLNGEYVGVLYDPPYSGRQVSECYKELGIPVSTNHTNSNFYWKVKREIAPKIKVGGYAICCGWNSGGFGKKYGFELIEILVVCHGSSHNDTIVTVEKKIQRRL